MDGLCHMLGYVLATSVISAIKQASYFLAMLDCTSENKAMAFLTQSWTENRAVTVVILTLID